MYVPTNSAFIGGITPITSVDVTLHTFLGVSWHILLPYTIFGAALMAYGQTRLLIGQQQLKSQEAAFTIDEANDEVID
jgi:hypothetical protein